MPAVNPATHRTYAGRTGAQRAGERRAALIEAAVALVAQDGWPALRIDRLCAGAGLNKRYFYESFADLEAVIVAVLDTLARSAIDATLAAMDRPGELAEVVHAGISALVRHLAGDPRRARVLLGESAAGETAARHRAAAIQQIVRAADAQSRHVLHVEDVSDPAIELAVSLLVGGTRQAVLDWLDGRLHDDLERFIDDLAALWLLVGFGIEARSRRGG